MRHDVEKAIARTGASIPRFFNAACEQLGDALGDERALAITAATRPKLTKFDGASVGEQMRSNMGFLLVLTENDFVEVHEKGKLSRGKLEFMTVRLARVQDYARSNSRRRGSRLGAKDRFLAFDHLRGSELVTEVYDLPDDDVLERFVAAMNGHLDALAQATSERAALEQQASLQRMAETIAARQTSSASAADELSKLAGLRDQGVLSDEEFARMKARILAPD